MQVTGAGEVAEGWGMASVIGGAIAEQGGQLEGARAGQSADCLTKVRARNVRSDGGAGSTCTMGASPPEMRIDVAPDGHVQLAVSLSTAVDPALVASVVAAVRRGIVNAAPAPAPPAVSVRDRARQIDARHRYDSPTREFASSPALTVDPPRPPALSERTNSMPARPPARNPARASPPSLPSSRSLSDLTDDQQRAAALPDDDAAAAVVPASPYVHAPSFARDDPDDPDSDHAWDAVEYVATDERPDGMTNAPFLATEHQWHRPPNVPVRSNGWRLLASWASFRKRPTLDRTAQDSTLAAAAPPTKRVRARTLFSRPKDPAADWMEFSSTLGVERILAEVGNILKVLQYQVWRRAGENKLRCVRRLSTSEQMHVVVVVGCVALPRASVSVVRLRRAKGDRNRTEHWRFQVLFRELVHRLRANGVDVCSEQS